MKKIRISHKSGEKYFRWTLIEFDHYVGTAQKWLCKCDCGTIKSVRMNDLRTGKNKSCGCLTKEKTIKHDESFGDKKTKEYSAWSGIKSRCLNPNNKAYKNYGGRGITVCQRWVDDYNNFLSDMGRAPSKDYSLDRWPDCNGNYEPNNCRWATRLEQLNNRRNTIFITVDGVRMCLSDACAIKKLNTYWFTKE